MPGLYGLRNVYDRLHDGNANVTNCSDGIQWVWVVTEECIYNVRGEVSTVIGLLSVLTWMCVSIPQMVKNCRNLSGMVGISFWLMMQWFLGDATNLIGSILTHQLKIQVYTAIWFVTADVMLLMQYVAYRCQKCKEGKVSPVTPNTAILCLSGLFLVGGFGYHLDFLFPWMTRSSLPMMHHHAGRSLMATNVQMHNIFLNYVDIMGYTAGVISTLFYVGSRLAQIYKNYQLKSTEGLSKFMFCMAVLGNILYGGAIIVKSLDGVFIIRHLPWIMGSLGVVFLDLALLFQFRHYEQTNFDSLLRAPLLSDEEIVVDPPDAYSVNRS